MTGLNNTIPGLVLATLLLCGPLRADERRTVLLVTDTDSIRLESPAQIQPVLNGQLFDLADKGYPNAVYRFSSYSGNSRERVFTYRLERGESVRVDSIIYGVFSSAENSMLEFFAGKPDTGIFDLSDYDRAAKDLMILNELAEIGNPVLEENSVHIPVLPREKTAMNGILQYKNEGKPEVLGEVSLELVNFLRLGRIMSFHWRHPELSDHDIGFDYAEYFPFSVPIRADAGFRQVFRDSLFIQRQYRAELEYFISRHFSAGLHVSREDVSANQSIETLDYRHEQYQSSGLQMSWTKENGSRGLRFNTRGGMKYNDTENYLYGEFLFRVSVTGLFTGLSITGKAAGVGSDGAIPEYFLYTPVSLELLSAEDPGSTWSERYAGVRFQGGFRQKGSRVFLFLDAAKLFPPERTILNYGIILSLPGRERDLQAVIAFNPDRPVSAGKLSVTWEF